MMCKIVTLFREAYQRAVSATTDIISSDQLFGQKHYKKRKRRKFNNLKDNKIFLTEVKNNGHMGIKENGKPRKKKRKKRNNYSYDKKACFFLIQSTNK